MAPNTGRKDSETERYAAGKRDDEKGARRSGRSAQKPDELSKPDSHEAGRQPKQQRTVGNHPADPNRVGADWNLLPPGISDEDVRDPGGMKDDADRAGGRKK
ncbi:hypothetical protein [Pusillimonas sp.]|uniref:hypothetical protein n=1 Tax=Pusillimonas sp. TaxID=3040095 RepID=UPI00299FC7D5|nr:hypothetical protein [Pusillimonas sp.]MDX3893168.1 hypothetical protein [Pusillimonas sp.]